MICYLDASVVLRWLFHHADRYMKFGSWQSAVTGEMCRIECLRTLQRLRLDGAIDDEELGQVRMRLDELLGDLSILQLTESVKERASDAFPTIIGTLDAIHLASALLYRAKLAPELKIITHDAQLARAGRAESFEVLGV